MGMFPKKSAKNQLFFGTDISFTGTNANRLMQ